MTSPVIVDEYPLYLSTGETIKITEIDAERSPITNHPKIREALDGLLQHCSHISREIVEEAKGGYDTNFKLLLRAQPMGCMAKANPHECLHIRDCAMAMKSVCTLHNCLPSKTPLPICWEFSPSIKIDDIEIKSSVIELGTIIGHSWRTGKYIILVF